MFDLTYVLRKARAQTANQQKKRNARPQIHLPLL